MFFKSLIPTTLLLVLLAPPIWVSSWFASERSVIRREVRSQLMHGIKDADLVVLTFSKSEVQRLLHWERDDEFEYRGKMYDVVKVEEHGERISYLCWPDEPESELNQKLMLITAQLFNHAPKPKEQGVKLVLFFKSLFFNANFKIHLYPPNIRLLTQNEARNSYQVPDLERWETPPRA